MLPPIRYVDVSRARDARAWKVGECDSDGGLGRSVSAYLGKYCDPYGELKHSGRTMMLAPARDASRILERARVRLAALSAPGGENSEWLALAFSTVSASKSNQTALGTCCKLYQS